MSDIARLRWQCRRGSKELDLLFSHYLENYYNSASREEQAYFKRLIELDDGELLRNQEKYVSFLKQLSRARK